MAFLIILDGWLLLKRICSKVTLLCLCAVSALYYLVLRGERRVKARVEPGEWGSGRGCL